MVDFVHKLAGRDHIVATPVKNYASSDVMLDMKGLDSVKSLSAGASPILSNILVNLLRIRYFLLVQRLANRLAEGNCKAKFVQVTTYFGNHHVYLLAVNRKSYSGH